MTRPRKEQVHLDAPFYHCYVRCVRRAFLCGTDHFSGRNIDHRKQWLVSRLRFLSYVYAIDICAYAIMSNHYHVVVHVDKKRAERWSQVEIAERWLQLYSAPLLVQKWLKNPADCDKAELEVVAEIIEQWRTRLHDVGWFMRGVNEVIARMANDEDKTKGRFWEGRYKSQALLDEVAVLSCMAYVDLNPVRAGVCEDAITSDFTSIQQRLFNYAQQSPQNSTAEQQLVQHVETQQITGIT
ncbi:MAG: nitrogen fixation protein NifB [Marinagarivorans sp.]